MVRAVQEAGIVDHLHDLGGILQNKGVVQLSPGLHDRAKLLVVGLGSQNCMLADLVRSQDPRKICNELL